MNDYIHSHLSYDEIITDEQQIPEQRETRIKIYPSKDKPFRIERSKQTATNSTQRLKSTVNVEDNPETIPIRDRKDEGSGGKIEKLNGDYESDFQFYEEDVEESIVNQFKMKENNMSCELAATRKNKNYSAVLPRIDKITPAKGNGSNRYTQMSNQRERIMKSTIELREENKKLVRDIETFRRFLPVFKKNQIIINLQSQELQKIKNQRAKFFDISYELSLDKNVNQKVENIGNVQGKIKQQESIMKFRRNKVIKNIKGKLSRVREQQIDPQPELISQFTKLRQHVLSKKRQEESYERRISDLQAKIDQYHQILEDLEERSKIGIHEVLKKRKIVLEYDIQMKRAQFQQKQCELIVEITQLNNKSSQLEIKCSEINAQLNEIALRRLEAQEETLKKVKKEENVSIEIDQSPKKQRTRLLRLFGRKR